MSKKPTLALTKKFIEGLKKYNLTYNDIVNSGWKYCGGDTGPHKNYFFLQNFYKGDTFPATTNKCICEHKIKENCYITNGERLLVLGNCCIKKFVPDSGRTCDKCGNKHKNRKINRCNTCREKTFYKKCDKCHRTHSDKYILCYTCTLKIIKS